MAGRFDFLMPYGGRGHIAVDAEEAVAEIQRPLTALERAKARLLQIWGNIVREDFRRQFAEGGEPPWKQLAPSTIAQKAAAGLPPVGKGGRNLSRLKQKGIVGPGNILIAGGQLRDSYCVKSDPNHVEKIDEASGELEVGSKDPKAIFHQKGTKPYQIGPKTAKALSFMVGGGKTVVVSHVNHPGLTARPVRITDTAKEKMRQALEAHLAGGDSGQETVD